jgi:hypothetical protein
MQVKNATETTPRVKTKLCPSCHMHVPVLVNECPTIGCSSKRKVVIQKSNARQMRFEFSA